MATATDTKIYRNSGRLIQDPTDLGDSNNSYGGTELGAQVRIRLVERMRVVAVIGEEYDEPIEEDHGAIRPYVDVLFRAWDTDALTLIYPSTAGSGDSFLAKIPGTAKSGRAGTDSAVKILFVPDNIAHDAFLMFSAVPRTAEENVIWYANLRERVFMARFTGVRDGSGRILHKGLISALSL